MDLSKNEIKGFEELFLSKFVEEKSNFNSWIINNIIGAYDSAVFHFKGIIEDENSILSIEKSFLSEEKIKELKNKIKDYLKIMREVYSLVFEMNEQLLLKKIEEYKVNKKYLAKFYEFLSKKWEAYEIKAEEKNESHFG